MPAEPRVAAVVVTFNSRSLLPALLASVDAAAGAVVCQMIFVDNGSTDGTVDFLRSLQPAPLVVDMGRNAGYAAGLNAGVAAADPHDAVLVLNPDVRLGPHCIAALLSAVQVAGTGIAVPRVTNDRGELTWSMRRRPSALRAFGDALLGARRAGRYPLLGDLISDPRAYDESTVCDWAEGSVQLISADCWLRCGPWDESFFLYSEETEYDLRAGDAGYRVQLVPKARAVHLGGDSQTSPALWSLLTYNKVRLHRRRTGPFAVIPYWLAMVSREATRSMLGKRTSRAALAALLIPSKGYLSRKYGFPIQSASRK